MRKKNFLSLALAFVVGCSASSTATPPPIPLPSVAITLAATRAPATPTLQASGAMTLTLWTTEEFAPSASAPGSLWRDEFAAFHAANPDIGFDVVLKKPDGKGGMLDSLVTTSAVAPALLPDAVLINASDVSLAADKKIFQPLDGIVSDDLKNDRFPFADQFAAYQNQWVAIPFAADVQHMVYNQAAVPIAPRTWDDLSRQKTTLLLPLGSDDAFLLQYSSFGASLNNFDPFAATQVFSFFKRAHDANLMPDVALNAKSADDAWDAFAQGQIAMAQVRAGRYLTDQGNLPPKLNAAYAPVPTRDGKTTALATAWSLAIVTNDPARKNAAARWINWMMKTEQLAPYVRAEHRLPTTRSLLAPTIAPKEYAAFLRDILERAIPMPSIAQNGKQADAWRAGIAAVWRGQMTPEEAARSVVAAGR